MKKYPLIGTLCAVALAIGIPATASAQDVEPRAGDCFGSMDNPHDSTGAGGIIAKARFACASDNASSHIDARLAMFECRTSFVPEKNWQKLLELTDAGNCLMYTEDYGTWNDPHNEIPADEATAPKQATRYIPASGKPGIQGQGYFVAVIQSYRVVQYPGGGEDHLHQYVWANDIPYLDNCDCR